VIQHFKKACKNYVFKTWIIALLPARYHFLCVEFSKFYVNQSLAGQTITSFGYRAVRRSFVIKHARAAKPDIWELTILY
jgi:hypothetical protein